MAEAQRLETIQLEREAEEKKQEEERLAESKRKEEEEWQTHNDYPKRKGCRINEATRREKT